jgi:DNA-binding CsgD family transcriptional regulator
MAAARHALGRMSPVAQHPGFDHVKRELAPAALAVPLPLTRRERAIATLAAGGLSNRQIDNRLMVSVRAVEGHLYHACTKLGTSDRTELAALIHGD